MPRHTTDSTKRFKRSLAGYKAAVNRTCPSCLRKAALCKDTYGGFTFRFCRYCDYIER